MVATGGRISGRAPSVTVVVEQSSSSERRRSPSPVRRTSTYICHPPCCQARCHCSSQDSCRKAEDSSQDSSGRNEDPSSSKGFWFFLFTVFVVGIFAVVAFPTQSGTSVLQVQIGFLGSTSSLQRNLNEIAKVSNTSTREGLSNVLSDTVVALLRHHDFVISGYSSVAAQGSSGDAERLFNKRSMAERMKFDVETLANVQNNFRVREEIPGGAQGFYEPYNNDYMVVTFLVEVEGRHELPVIVEGKDLQRALEKLGAIPRDKINAVEVLWTPQKENDRLSRKELNQGFPNLRPLSFHN